MGGARIVRGRADTVLIVCEDELLRRGLVDCIRERLEGTDVMSCTVSAIDAWDGDWSRVAVLMTDPVTPDGERDRFSGVRVIEHYRAVGPAEGLAVVISDGVQDPLVRLRLAEAGATSANLRSRCRGADDVVRALGGGGGLALTEVNELLAYGLTPRSRLNAGIRWLDDGPAAAWIDGMTEPTRRQAIRTRQTLASIVGIEPCVGGTGAVVERSVPTWRHTVAVMRAARGLPSALSSPRRAL